MKKRIVRLLIGLLIVLMLGAAGFVLWGSQAAGPSEIAMEALNSDGEVKIESQNGWLIFSPQDKTPSVGFIFYPGGKVDYRSYAPLLREIARAGYLVVDVRMPLNLAVFGADRASHVIKAFPQIRQWAIGGHSLGGAMAARYTYQNPEMVDGLVLWAAYPAEDNDLSQRDNLAVVSIYASNDGLATTMKIDQSRPRLPSSASFVEIIGGNHAGFGSYGEQGGDLPAEITPEDQWFQTVTATVQLLELLE